MPTTSLLVSASVTNLLAVQRGRRSVTSRKTRTQPTTSPSLHRIGAALSSMGPCAVLRDEDGVVGQPNDDALAQGLVSGFSTGRAVFVDDAEHGVERPPGLVLAHPVSSSATGFMLVTRPPVSVVITASPMLAVMLSRFLPVPPEAFGPPSLYDDGSLVGSDAQ